MDDTTDERIARADDRRRRGGGGLFIAGLIIGLLLAGLVYLLHKMSENNSSSNNSASSAMVSTAKGAALIAAGGDQTFYASSVNYSTMLVEAARESIDTPSAEGDQAQAALATETDKLVKALNGNSTLQNDVTAFNSAVLAYAKSGTKDAGDITTALTKITNDLKSTYDVTNGTDFNTVGTDFKNNLIASIDKFNAQDYSGSYESQESANNSLLQVFSHLKNK